MASKKAFLGVGGKPRFPQPDQQKHIDSVSKNIAILTGQTKNTKDRAVLFRDLQDFGLVDKRGKFVGLAVAIMAAVTAVMMGAAPSILVRKFHISQKT